MHVCTCACMCVSPDMSGISATPETLSEETLSTIEYVDNISQRDPISNLKKTKNKKPKTLKVIGIAHWQSIYLAHVRFWV